MDYQEAQKGETMRKVAEVSLVTSMLLAGGSIDSIFDSVQAALTWAVIVLVMIVSAIVIGSYDD